MITAKRAPFSIYALPAQHSTHVHITNEIALLSFHARLSDNARLIFAEDVKKVIIVRNEFIISASDEQLKSIEKKILESGVKVPVIVPQEFMRVIAKEDPRCAITMRNYSLEAALMM